MKESLYVQNIRLTKGVHNEYPFSLPIIRELHSIELEKRVTFFVGEHILDEPEAALSPMHQMSMLVQINELVNKI